MILVQYYTKTSSYLPDTIETNFARGFITSQIIGGTFDLGVQ